MTNLKNITFCENLIIRFLKLTKLESILGKIKSIKVEFSRFCNQSLEFMNI